MLFLTRQSCQPHLLIFVFQQVQKEYRKIVRRHSWLSRCVGCEERSSGAGSSGSGSGESKERRTSLYTGHAHSTESTSGGSSGIAGPVGISSSSHHPPGHHPGPTNHHGTSVGRPSHRLPISPMPSPDHQGM